MSFTTTNKEITMNQLERISGGNYQTNLEDYREHLYIKYRVSDDESLINRLREIITRNPYVDRYTEEYNEFVVDLYMVTGKEYDVFSLTKGFQPVSLFYTRS